MILREPTVRLVAFTQFQTVPSIAWQTDSGRPAEQLIEFAGRMCYQSWNNPSGRTNQEYITNLLRQGHLSVLEHAQASFAISGISRSCSHELVRHRHFSFSQMSQRYVAEEEANFVEPERIANNPRAHALFVAAVEKSRQAYEELVKLLGEELEEWPDRRERRLIARQSARAVLPNATETRLVMTGNFRAWRHFLRLRGSRAAEGEIRRLALAIHEELVRLSPACFGDFQRVEQPDGVIELVTSLTSD